MEVDMQRLCVVLLVFTIVLGIGCDAQQDEEEIARLPEVPHILAAEDVPWEDLSTDMRRKVLFSGELTFVFLELKGPTSEPIQLHSHVNDQISYVVDGELEVQVGEVVRRIGKGGFFRVPPDIPHGARALSPVVQFVDVFTPPREDFRRD